MVHTNAKGGVNGMDEKKKCVEKKKEQTAQEHKEEHKGTITPTIPNYTSTRVTTQDPQVSNTIKGKIQWQSSSQIQRKRGLGGSSSQIQRKRSLAGSLLPMEVLKSSRILPYGVLILKEGR